MFRRTVRSAVDTLHKNVYTDLFAIEEKLDERVEKVEEAVEMRPYQLADLIERLARVEKRLDARTGLDNTTAQDALRLAREAHSETARAHVRIGNLLANQDATDEAINRLPDVVAGRLSEDFTIIAKTADVDGEPMDLVGKPPFVAEGENETEQGTFVEVPCASPDCGLHNNDEYFEGDRWYTVPDVPAEDRRQDAQYLRFIAEKRFQFPRGIKNALMMIAERLDGDTDATDTYA